MKTKTQAIILFDGVCNLCQGSVNFIIDRDSEARFRFASLQSEIGQRLLKEHNRSIEADPSKESVILIENGNLYDRSTAALRIAKRLSAGWPVFYVFILVPRFLRDKIYQWIAQNRYRWFGKRESCRMPTPELKERFLDKDEAIYALKKGQ